MREIADKSCANDAMPFVVNHNFLCDVCVGDNLTLANVPKCPACSAATVKAYGCNHIECSRCRAHWCYVCGVEFDRAEIYDHLISVHGGMGIEDAAAAELGAAAALGVDPIQIDAEFGAVGGAAAPPEDEFEEREIMERAGIL